MLTTVIRWIEITEGLTYKDLKERHDINSKTIIAFLRTRFSSEPIFFHTHGNKTGSLPPTAKYYCVMDYEYAGDGDNLGELAGSPNQFLEVKPLVDNTASRTTDEYMFVLQRDTSKPYDYNFDRVSKVYKSDFNATDQYGVVIGMIDGADLKALEPTKPMFRLAVFPADWQQSCYFTDIYNRKAIQSANDVKLALDYYNNNPEQVKELAAPSKLVGYQGNSMGSLNYMDVGGTTWRMAFVQIENPEQD